MENANTRRLTTIGLLYPGELGARLGAMLREDGLRVVTTLEGRGVRTRERCRQAGLETVRSLPDLAAASEIVLAVVHPSSALSLAERYVACADAAPRDALYLDLNSVSPQTAGQIGMLLAGRDLRFVDASVHGRAANLPAGGTLYLSGEDAAVAAALLGRTLRVEVLSQTPGTASAFKMLLSGVSKGMSALFLEVALLAREADMLDPFLATCDETYPGLAQMIERLLPTFPAHASRRAEEMAELEHTMLCLDLQPTVIAGVARLISELGRLNLECVDPTEPDGSWSAREVVEAAHNRDLLRRRV